MKVAYVITRSDVMGGASIHLLDLARGMRQAGHDVVIIAGGNGVLSQRVKSQGDNYVSLKYLVREINLSKDFLGYFELKRAIRAISPDIVHLHSSKAGILGRLVARSLKIPAVFTAHGWAFTEGVSNSKRLLYVFIERSMSIFVDKIITVSNYDRSLALRYGVADENTIRTIHNGMPVLGNYSAPKSAETVKLIMVARFESPKNHLFLIEALSQLQSLNWSIELVGDGPLLPVVAKLVEKLNLSGRVIFSGACDNVSERLARSDIFLLISNWEGLPLTILEAMRAGLPVIASNVGGVSETIVHNESGVLVKRNSLKELCDAVCRLIQSEELRSSMGRRGREKFLQEFTFETMLSKTLDVYDSVLSLKK